VKPPGPLSTVPVVLAFLLVGCVTAASYRLTDTMPDELPNPATLAGWEKLAGQAEMGDTTAVYELYVNPLRPALYEVTRFQLTTSTTDADGRTRRAHETEKVLWNAAPGTREPLLCFEWTFKRTWRTLWLTRIGRWRQMEPGTPDYKEAMRMAIRVYAARNQSGTD